VPGGVIPPGTTVPPHPSFGTFAPTVFGMTYAPQLNHGGRVGHFFDPTNASSLVLCDNGTSDNTAICFREKLRDERAMLNTTGKYLKDALEKRNRTALESVVQDFFCHASRNVMYEMIACLPYPPCKDHSGDFEGRHILQEWCTNGTESTAVLATLFLPLDTVPQALLQINALFGDSSRNFNRSEMLAFFNCSKTTCAEDVLSAQTSFYLAQAYAGVNSSIPGSSRASVLSASTYLSWMIIISVSYFLS